MKCAAYTCQGRTGLGGGQMCTKCCLNTQDDIADCIFGVCYCREALADAPVVEMVAAAAPEQ
jgi:hypothetical protein